MKTVFYFLLGLILLSTFISGNYSPVGIVRAQQASGTRIDIGIQPNGEYNVSYLELQKNTTYTIYFWNELPAAYNLVIAVSGRNVTTNTLNNNTDLVIGPTLSNNTSDYGSPGKFWEANWTTPNADTYIIYFCPFPGRFPTTLGIFVIGSPTYAPPIQIPSEGPSQASTIINDFLIGGIVLLGSIFIVVCLISFIKYKKFPGWQLTAFFLLIIALEVFFLIIVNINSFSTTYF